MELGERVISGEGKMMDSNSTQLVGFKCRNSTKKKDGLRTQILKHRTNSQ